MGNVVGGDKPAPQQAVEPEKVDTTEAKERAQTRSRRRPRGPMMAASLLTGGARGYGSSDTLG